MRVIALVSMLLVFIFSGCMKQEPEVKYVKAPTFKFEKIDLKGAYIELKSVDDRKRCSPYLLQMKEVYDGVIDFYNYQIDEYNKFIKEQLDGNTTSKNKVH